MWLYGRETYITCYGRQPGFEIYQRYCRRLKGTYITTFQVCHICGKGAIDETLVGLKGYKQFEYVTEEQPHLFAMSDVVVSRAGATTLFEWH